MLHYLCDHMNASIILPQANPRALGTEIEERTGELPFMLKVLSIKTALSIQVRLMGSSPTSEYHGADYMGDDNTGTSR